MFQDHPPTYDEVHDAQEQPPCFCEAIKLPIQSEAATTSNVDNSGVGAEGNEQGCTCGKNRAQQQRY